MILSLWGFFISIKPPRYLSNITPQDLALTFENVSFETSDGLTLQGWWIPRQSPTTNDSPPEVAGQGGQNAEEAVGLSEPAKTIILLHGYPADKGDILPSLAFLNRTYNLLLFDFRYLGESEGTYSTAGVKEVGDLLAALRYLKTRGVERVGVWGFSMGGAVALMGAAESPVIAAVVSETSYASLATMAPELYRLPLLRHPLAWLTELWGRVFLSINIRKTSPVKAAEQLTIPVLLIHSKDDRVIPFSHALTLKDALKANAEAEFWFEAGLAHGELNTKYQERIRSFFDANL